MNKIGQSAGKNLAWLAGFLEGDGSIILAKQRIGKNRIIYTPLVNVTNTDHSLIEYVSKIMKEYQIGHYFTARKTKNGISKVLLVKGFKRVKKLLPLIIPEMYGKRKQQAICLLEWIHSRELTGNNHTYTEHEMELFEKIKELKKPDNPQRLHARPQ